MARHKRKIAIASVGAFAVVIGAGASAYAAIPASDTGQITACRTPRTGAIRVIDYEVGSRCRPGEMTLHWAVKGEKGDTGAHGAKGEEGDTGAQGEKGDTGATGAQG
ncbi:MAG TPA: hypothetical protein VFY17_01835, partial [Pilimelia sp.]|nr:hypothetical protein [Pilimelia sp.]